MGKIKITYRLSETGRKVSLLAGGNGREIQTVEVDATPDLLALATVDTSGAASIVAMTDVTTYTATWDGRVQENYGNGTRPLVVDALPPADVATWVLSLPAQDAARSEASRRDADDKATAIRAERAASAAEEARKKAEAEALDAKRIDLARSAGQRYLDGDVSVEFDPRNWGKLSSPEFAGVTLEGAALDRLREDLKAEYARRKILPIVEWVRGHGSERLRKALDLGLLDQTLGVYRDERLTLEMPGWRWDSEETAEEDEKIRNPSLAALRALEEARKSHSNAYLCKVRPKAEEDEETAPRWREAVRVDDLFGGENIAYRLIDRE